MHSHSRERRGPLGHVSGLGESKTGAPRGRPVDHAIDGEVRQAVLQALRQEGYRSVTMEGIARSVGRARASLYRRWPSKRHLVAYTIVSEMGPSPAPDTGSVRSDLCAAVETLVSAFRGALMPALAGLVGEMRDDPSLARAIRREVLARRRASIRAAFERGIARGEVRAGLDLELFMDLLTAPFYFRALFGHQPLTKTLIAGTVDAVLAAAAPR